MTKDITFSLPAEAMQGANEAIILGDFNNWNPELAPKLVRQEDGTFSTAIPLEEGETYHYRFLLDNARWVNDYNAQRYEPAAGLNIDNCVITVPESSEIIAPKRASKKAAKVSADKDIKPVAAKAAKKATKAGEEKKIKAKASETKVAKPEKPKAVKKASPKTEG